VAIAIISSFGQLGSFAGPYIIGFLTDFTGKYAAGTYYLSGSYVIAGLLMLLLRSPKPVSITCESAASLLDRALRPDPDIKITHLSRQS
jgi:MFS family permease